MAQGKFSRSQTIIETTAHPTKHGAISHDIESHTFFAKKPLSDDALLKLFISEVSKGHGNYRQVETLWNDHLSLRQHILHLDRITQKTLHNLINRKCTSGFAYHYERCMKELVKENLTKMTPSHQITRPYNNHYYFIWQIEHQLTASNPSHDYCAFNIEF